MRTRYATSPARFAVLPTAPITASPVPGLTSLYHKAGRGNYGSAAYPGHCSGEPIEDLIRYFRPRTVLHPMTGSGTGHDVGRELRAPCRSSDIHAGLDACDPTTFEGLGEFDFVWLHAPYWRQKLYTEDLRDMSRAPTLPHFLDRYGKLIANGAGVLSDHGKLAILVGDYSDREAGFVPLACHTRGLAFEGGAQADLHRHHPVQPRRVERQEGLPLVLHPRPARHLRGLRAGVTIYYLERLGSDTARSHRLAKSGIPGR